MQTDEILRALVQAVTELARALRSSDSRQNRDSARLLAELQELRAALLVSLGKSERSGVYVDDDHVTARVPRAALVSAGWTIARRLAPIALAAAGAAVGWLWRHLVG